MSKKLNFRTENIDVMINEKIEIFIGGDPSKKRGEILSLTIFSLVQKASPEERGEAEAASFKPQSFPPK